MSTILDALRRVQREREASNSADTLLDAVSAAPEGARRDPPRRGRGPLPFFALAMILLVGGATVWALLSDGLLPKRDGQTAAKPAATADAAPPTTRAPAAAAPRAPQTRRERHAAARARGERRARARPSVAAPRAGETGRPAPTEARRDATPEDVADITPTSPSPGADPVTQTAGAVTRPARAPEPLPSTSPPVTEPTLPAPALAADAAERPPAPAAELSRAAPKKPARSSSAPAPAQASAKPPAPPEASPSDASANAPRAEASASEPEPSPDTSPRARGERSASASEPSDTAPSAARAAPLPAQPFPEVRIDRVRWHPEAERRLVWLEIDRAGPFEAREGDILAGAMIRRIDPGAVEIQIGSLRRRVPVEP